MTRARKIGLIATMVAVLASPFLAHALMYASYLGAYVGHCGPHAPDIVQHACSYAQYKSEFGQGFGGVGLFIFDGIVGIGAATLAAVVWLAIIVLSRKRAT